MLGYSRFLELKDMVKNDIDYKIAMLVVGSYWHVEDRVTKLKELGYLVSYIWVKNGGIGTIRHYDKSDGVQVSAARGSNFAQKAYVAFKR